MNKILFLGDFFYNFDVEEEDIGKISEYIRKNNYSCILNLEGCLAKSDEKIKKRGPNLYQSKITIDILKKLNVIGVTLANNHIMDFGEKALKETILMLDEADIKHCGAGTNISEALKPMIFKFENKNIIIYNYGWNIEETVYASDKKCGCAPKEDECIYVKKEKENDVLIKILHWGFEYNIFPMPFDIDKAHKMIDTGTDLIIGHHPHVIQSKEKYKDKSIYYSLGNFYFSGRRKLFLRKKFVGKIEDKCSYGLGVVYDILNEKVEKEMLIYYDSVNDKSSIIEGKINNEILSDISNVDFKEMEYISKIKKTKLNHNPILTTNKVLNNFKLFKLEIIYVIKKIIKKLLAMLKIDKRSRNIN